MVVLVLALVANAGLLRSQEASTETDLNFAVPKDPRVTRILTFNIRGCRGLDDTIGLRPELSGNVIAAVRPDAAGLQEVDRNNSRSDWKDQIEQLGEITGLHPFYGKAIDFAGGEYGIGILSKCKPCRVRKVPLPGSEEPRTLVEAEFDDFVLFNTHLSLDEPSRLKSAEVINEELIRYEKPVVLTGDLNVSGNAEWQLLFGGRWTALTPDEPSFPADTPRERLDYIMIADPKNKITVNAPIWKESVVKSGVISTIASDHRPVYVDLDMIKIKSEMQSVHPSR